MILTALKTQNSASYYEQHFPIKLEQSELFHRDAFYYLDFCLRSSQCGFKLDGAPEKGDVTYFLEPNLGFSN